MNNIKSISKRSLIGLTALTATFAAGTAQKPTDDRPNILWIVSEDNSSSFIGCYGNSFTTTPNIDNLAGEGFMYTHAYCTHAVCSPTRNSIITGVFANSNGNIPMRSDYATSDLVHTYPEYLRQAGYYCTNNSKTDYNSGTIDEKGIWDESSGNAHYKNRQEGAPFFAIFNLMSSHESSVNNRQGTPYDSLRHKPEDVILPPYQPDLPQIRYDWAVYYDAIEQMDSEVGALLKELEDSGLANNTIVFYYADNGGVLPRSKRFMYETGTHDPLIIRIPEKYKDLYPAEKPGDKVDRMVSFVDFAPTLCSLAGVPIPEYMQGVSFMGEQKAREPRYVYMARGRMDERYDNSIAVADQKFRYIHNYMPFRPALQFLRTLYGLPSMEAWYDDYRAGNTNPVQSMFFQERATEELYDIENDPWNINNLAAVPAYHEVLVRMREAAADWRKEIRDVLLIPEDEYDYYSGPNTKYKSMYDYMHSAECPFNELVEASELATVGGPEDINTFVEYLQNEHSGIRYWGATGLLLLKGQARPAIEALKKAAYDRAGSVATLSAEALYRMGEKEEAMKAYINILQDMNTYDYTDRNWALNSIDIIDESDHSIATKQMINAIRNIVIYRNANSITNSNAGYEMRTAPYILQSWGIEVPAAPARQGGAGMNFGTGAPQ